MTSVDWVAIGSVLTAFGLLASLVFRIQSEQISALKTAIEHREINFNVLCEAVEQRIKHLEDKAGSYQELEKRLHLLHELKPKLEEDKRKIEEEIKTLEAKRTALNQDLHADKLPQDTSGMRYTTDYDELIKTLSITSGTISEVLEANNSLKNLFKDIPPISIAFRVPLFKLPDQESKAKK